MKILLFLIALALTLQAQDLPNLDFRPAAPRKPLAPLESDTVKDPLAVKPESRLADLANVFEPASRVRLTKILKREYSRHRISIYVVTVSTMDAPSTIKLGEQLRKDWITDDLGGVLVYSRSTDKVSVALTDAAIKKIKEGGPIQELANQIDKFNFEGPTRGLPKSITAILNQLRVSQDVGTAVDDKPLPLFLIYGPILIVLLILGIGMYKVCIILVANRVFTRTHVLHTPPVQTSLGSKTGGINTVEMKF